MPQVSSSERPAAREAALAALLAATAAAEQSHFWFRGFRRFVRPMLDTAAGGRHDLRIADCGAGTGSNLRMLARYGTAIGIELTAEGARLARARGERRMCIGDVASLPLPSASFDLATSFDVLYCLDDDAERAALAEMHRVLKPGGRLIVNVAAMPSLRGRHSAFSYEVRRYTRRGLVRALEQAGFTAARATYTNAATLPLVAGTRALQRLGLFAADSAGDLHAPPAPINAALSGALAIEAALLRAVDMPFGSSLLALAVKRQ